MNASLPPGDGHPRLPRTLPPAAVVLLLLLPLLLCHPAPSPAAPSGDTPAVTGVSGTATGREARISFRLRNAFPPEMVEALKTGMEITFRYEARVELVRRGWFDGTLAEAEGTRSIRYDSLARVYRLQRGGKEELLPDVRAAMDAMTRYELSLSLDDEVARGDRVRAYARVRLDHVGLSEAVRTIFFFTRLWDVETSWGRGSLATP